MLKIASFIVVTVALLLVPVRGGAAYGAGLEGYKNIKFGITKEALKKLHPCSLVIGNPDAQGIVTAMCGDLPFNGSQAGAMFFLINNKLLRIGIRAGSSGSEFISVFKALSTKYGKPDGGTIFDAASGYDEGKINELGSYWDNGVSLTVKRGENRENVLLLYSDPRYDAAYTASIQKTMAGDL